MTARPEILDAVLEAIALVRGPIGRRADAGSLLEADLYFDSLDRITLAHELDQAFGIEIPDRELEEWASPAEAAACVERLTRDKVK